MCASTKSDTALHERRAVKSSIAASPCMALAFEQPLHQPPRQHPGDAPPVMAWREGGLHWHDLIAHERVEALDHAFIERAAAKFLGAREQHGARIGAGET